MSQPVIEVANLRKVFGTTVAVADVSFTVQRGELLGFLGPNGAGKTTTIAMLLGLIAPTQGQIRILGYPMPQRRGEILARANFSSPYVALPYDLTVRRNLLVFALLYDVRAPHQRIEELADIFNVTHLLEHRTGQLSSGEIARVNLVKAFLNNPEVLFLDEPTAALDPEAADSVRSLLLRLQAERRMTIFYTSQNMGEVERLSTRILFIHRGRIVADGPAAAVLQQSGKANLEEFFVALARSRPDAS